MEIECIKTEYFSDTRSYMTLGENKRDYIPDYHDNIYEFDEEEI